MSKTIDLRSGEDEVEISTTMGISRDESERGAEKLFDNITSCVLAAGFSRGAWPRRQGTAWAASPSAQDAATGMCAGRFLCQFSYL